MHADPLGVADRAACDPLREPQRAAGAPGGWGLVAWEQTLGDLLSGAGYGCAAYGKWHVGEGPGRWPTDKGFEEWYGPPRTYDESLRPDDPWYDPQRDRSHGWWRSGTATTTSPKGISSPWRSGATATGSTCGAARRSSVPRPGTTCRFVYFNDSLMHMPVIPREDFEGQTGHGDWADSLLELDTDFGALLDLLDALDLAGNTLVVFAGDNGPEEVLLWRGTPGYWEGSYFAGGEGNLRTPCIVRRPGHIPGGQVSDDIMHVTDWFTTLVRAAGAEVPAGRVIDGVNQLAWLSGQRSSSLRDGYLYWMGPELYGVKWRNFKPAFVAQQYSTDPVGKLSSPRIINLVADPQEREPLDLPYMHSWTVTHFNRLLGEFQASIEREPPVPQTPRSISPHPKHSNVHSSPDLADTHIRPACRALGG